MRHELGLRSLGCHVRKDWVDVVEAQAPGEKLLGRGRTLVLNEPSAHTAPDLGGC